jgi:hypothetical protein
MATINDLLLEEKERELDELANAHNEVRQLLYDWRRWSDTLIIPPAITMDHIAADAYRRQQIDEIIKRLRDMKSLGV